MRSLDPFWRVSQVPEHGLEIYPVGAKLSCARSLVHGIVDLHCQYQSMLDDGDCETEYDAFIVAQSRS